MTSASRWRWRAAGRARVRCLAPSRFALVLGILLGFDPRGASGAPPPVGPTTDAEDARRSAARGLARDGLALLNEEKFAAAEERLRRAYELVPAATVAVLRARALEKLDRLVEATEAYEAAVRIGSVPDATPAFRDAAQEAERALTRLRPEVPRLTITLAGVASTDPDLAVTLDDAPVPPALLDVPQPVDPGQHLILAAYHDTVHDTRWITVARGGTVKVLMRVDAAPAPAVEAPEPAVPAAPPSLQRRIGWGTVALGGAGMGVGVVAGIAMLRHKADLDAECRPDCPDALGQDLRAFRLSRTVSAIGYGVGALGLGLGVTLVVTAPRGEPQIVATFGADGLRVRGPLW
jgi:hypothetical protein